MAQREWTTSLKFRSFRGSNDSSIGIGKSVCLGYLPKFHATPPLPRLTINLQEEAQVHWCNLPEHVLHIINFNVLFTC